MDELDQRRTVRTCTAADQTKLSCLPEIQQLDEGWRTINR